MPREIVLEEQCCSHAESLGWLVRKVVYAGRRGAPDRWFLRRGKLLLVEFKRPGCKPDGLQLREHQKLHDVGGFKVHVIDNFDEFSRVLAAS